MDPTIAAPDAGDENGWIAAVLSATDATTAINLVLEHCAALTGDVPERLASALKGRADAMLRADLPASERYAQLLFALSDITANPEWRALGLRAQGNIESIGKREFAKAVSLYEINRMLFLDDMRGMWSYAPMTIAPINHKELSFRFNELGDET